jgi:flagellar hook-length control protein FliK
VFRSPVSGPATPGINTSRAAGTTPSGNTADDNAEPFSALMQGFFRGTQPTATAPASRGTQADTAGGDEPASADPVAGMHGLAAALPVAIAGPQSPTVAIAGLADGKPSPANGSNLPPTQPGLPAEPGLDARREPGYESQAVLPAARISLADIELGHQLDMAAAAPPPADTWTRRFMPMGGAPTAALPPAVATTDNPTDQLPGAETGSMLQQPAGLTAGDLSRLVQNLSQNGGREPFSAAFHVDGNSMNTLPAANSTVGPQVPETSLGSMLRSGLGSFPLLQPLGPAQAWTAGLGDRLLTLAGPGTHSARIKLHPESLGTLDIEIKVADNTAQVWFGAQHSQTREAIEASLPQLREMFAEQGIRLAHAQVDAGTEQRARDQRQAFDETENPGTAWRSSQAQRNLSDPPPPLRASTSRLVDAWA